MLLDFIFSHLRDMVLWVVIFSLAGAELENYSTVISNVAFSALLSFTMPMQLAELRSMLLELVLGPDDDGKVERNKEADVEGSRKLKEMLMLLGAIILGAVVTQLDWAVWFQRWPLPSVVLYSIVRALLYYSGKTPEKVDEKVE
ncbi:hypothetical protein, conserved [Trypanosoma brucei gambiense DAL972]|nr:hypothetical protein, conserved [Trypanosoma brucei gambiense DAL972]RHW68632.1 hypothetical protein DPX39_100126400 [Trypanosoma brucei equiperdum]CBH16348.1 hypothetical protein, conserved [Trypanosoma brucei gambiense DAL972]|eukprot:XP_011778612.1 hypothetical protein, conserved [Trypanosoma brucei gambiense DAL972]